MYAFHRFKSLPEEHQMEELSFNGIPLDLVCQIKNTETVLFVCLDLNVDLVVEKFSDEILALNCFKSIREA